MFIQVIKITFVQCFCVFLPSLLHHFCFCQVLTISVLYSAHPCTKYSLAISNLPIWLFSSISLCCLFKKAFFSLLAILQNSAIQFLPCLSLLFFPQLSVKPPQTTTLPSCISFSWGWFWSLPPVQCYELPSVVLQAICLLDLIPWVYSLPPLRKS